MNTLLRETKKSFRRTGEVGGLSKVSGCIRMVDFATEDCEMQEEDFLGSPLCLQNCGNLKSLLMDIVPGPQGGELPQCLAIDQGNTASPVHGS